MNEKELMNVNAPFQVRYKGKKRKLTVTGFARNDPLGVGGGFFPDIPVCFFKGGGWLLVADLIRYYELVKK